METERLVTAMLCAATVTGQFVAGKALRDTLFLTSLLPVLADLARRTQILLFTHHAHLVELCHDTLGSGSFHEHSLARA